MDIISVKNHNLKLSNKMPYCHHEIEEMSLEFNKNNDRDFEGLARCITFGMRENKIIEVGFNIKKTHPMYPDYQFTTHAEISLLLKLNKNIEKKKRITDVITFRGTTKVYNGLPCERCYYHLKKELKSIRMWYFFDDDWRTEIL